MKIYTTIFIIILLVAAGYFWSPTAIPAETQHPADFLMTVETFDHPGCSVDGQPCVHLTFSYPVFRDGSHLSDSLQAWTDGRIGGPGSGSSSPEELAGEWFGDYDRTAGRIEGYSIPWSLERSVEVIYRSRNVVSLHFNEFSFTGGAHPSQNDQFRSFDAREGGPVRLADLTNDSEQYGRLVRLAEEQFRFTYELLEDDDVEDSEFSFVDGRFTLPDNFAFTDYGLLFYFNSFEIAPFATRPIAVELPYDDLRFIVRTRYLKNVMQVI